MYFTPLCFKFLDLRRSLALLACFILAAIFATPVFAQANVNDLLAPYRDFKPAEDLATRVMEGLLGATYTSPLTSGLGTSTLFGAIFLVFNVIVFAVGTVWAGYGVIAGIVQTAHEGTVLGKRMSAIWMPVRMVTGIGGLVPAFGGFSLSQVVMIMATSWGISFANFAYNDALNMAANTATLTNAGFSKTDPNKNSQALATALFNQRICERAFEQKKRDTEANGLNVPEKNVVKEFPFSDIQKGTVVGRAVGTIADKSGCYAVGLRRKLFFNTPDARMSGSAVGFRSGAVNYEAVNNQVWNSYTSNFPTFVSKIQAIADRYHDAKVGRPAGEVRVPVDDIKAVGVWYVGAIQSAAQPVDQKAIKADALNNMAKYGFFSAGSFYSTFAEANAAVIQAANATDFVIVGPSAATRAQVTSGDYDFVYRDVEESSSAPTANSDLCLGTENATGNCSLGQKFVSLMIDAGTAGSGGGGDVIDPIIALKNIGDYMMTIGEGVLMLSTIVGTGTLARVVEAGVAVVSTATPGAQPLGIVTALAAILGPIAPYIGGLLFAVGSLCAIYIPMVPFINWVSGLVQYCCIVVESFAAAPLWALAHLQAEGEGMGQRTEKGYLYILNLLFRPILMVVAFFAASALVILLGSVVVQMYMPTVAAAQGNSVTGIFSAIGYIFLLFVILNIVITGLFHLVMELADDAIGWVGGIGRNNIGKDAEGKIHNMFMMGGRFGAGGADRATQAAKGAASAGRSGSIPSAPSRPKRA